MNLTPFLLFDGNCAEAMAFYQSCLGGELTITRLGDTPMGENAPVGQQARVVYSQLTCGSLVFSAVDWLHPTRAPHMGNTIGMYISGGSYRQLRTAFDKLAVDADHDLLDDLHEVPFGIYGHLADRYGVHWFFRGDAPQ
jgi:PhnB protein